MISAHRALDRIRSLSDPEVRELTVRRVLGEDVTPVESAYADEPSEDLIITLLQIDDLPDSTRVAVVQGLRDVHFKLYTWVASSEPRDASFGAENVAVRLCRAVDVAAPTELFPLISSLLRLVLDSPGVSAVVRKAVVRAVLGYPQREQHVELWTDALKVPELASYACNALLRIDPKANRVEEALIELWRRKYSDDWPVNAVGLLRRAARARGDDTIVSRVLSALKQEATASPRARKRWERVESDLRRSDRTSAWLDLAPAPSAALRFIDLPKIASESPMPTVEGPKMFIRESATGTTGCVITYTISMDRPYFAFIYDLNQTMKDLGGRHQIPVESSNQSLPTAKHAS